MGTQGKSRLSRLLNIFGPLLGLLFVIGVFSANGEIRPYFLSGANFKIILVQTVIVSICALGMTMIIISGGIDLSVGSASTEGREAGFLDTLKAKFPDIKIVSSDQYGGPTRETAYQAAQNLLNRYGRDVDGVFGSNETTAVGVIKAVRDIGKGGGKIKCVGFDGGTQLVSDLNKGDAQALVVQNPMRMGYLGVMTLVKHIRGETVEKRVDTGVLAVTPENKEQQEIKDLLNPPLSKYLD